MLERLRERLEPLLESVAAERHALALSELRVARVGATFARAADLFARERISDVQHALAASAGAEEKRTRALLEFLVHGRATCSTASELDQLLTWQAQTRVAAREGRETLRVVPAAAAGTADQQERAALLDEWLGAADEQTPLLEGYLARYREAVVELGYGGYVESCEVLSGIDLRGLAREAKRLLDDTEAHYRELLGWHLHRLTGTDPESATEADLIRVRRAASHDRVFGANLVWGLQTLLTEMGIDLLAGGRIRLETRRSLASGATALCHPLRIPEEIVCEVAPASGVRAHDAFLRVLGRSLHHAYTDPGLPLECRWLGDESVPLAAGAVLAGLLGNRVLLTRFYRIPQAGLEEYLRLYELLRLIRIRRDSGLLHFQLTLFEEPDSREARDAYAVHMEAATGVRHDPRGALLGSEPTFRVARRLRAEQLQGVVAGHLRDRFDEDWYRNPRTGEALLALFRPGQSYSASEVAVQLSSAPLSFETLKLELGV